MIKSKSRTIRYFFIVFLVIYVFFASPSGYFARKNLIIKVNDLETQITALKSENEELKEKIQLIKTDMNYIAELARKLGYAKKGEKIYRFKDMLDMTNQTNKPIKEMKKERSFLDTFLYFDAYTVFSLILLIILVIIAFKV
ncbi:MAG: septum formation initiator family protein [Spirochaetes bacterium]|nr:septum formation initiator family protein [Spirochaetota bacterium]